MTKNIVLFFTLVVVYPAILYSHYLLIVNFVKIYLLNSNYNKRVGKWFYTQPSNPFKWSDEEKRKLSTYGKRFGKGALILVVCIGYLFITFTIF